MQLYRNHFRAMGSPCQIRVYTESSSLAQKGMAAAQAAIRRLESKYSRYRPDTLTSRLNATAGTGEWVPVDDETHGLCEMAKQAFMLSDGLFDLTAGVLRKAWDFKSGRIATQADIDALLPLVGWEQIEWKRDSQAPSGWSMRLPLRGMELDFGGIVKEYAADTAATTLMTFDLSIALVDLGGDLRVMGAPPQGPGWRVGIRNPRCPDCPLSLVSLQQGAVATSGDYERYIEHNGRRYCHILNPHTGWPVSGLASATVIAEPCVVAGIASTVALLKGATAGLAWLRSLDVPFLLVTEMGTVITEQTVTEQTVTDTEQTPNMSSDFNQNGVRTA